MRVVGVVHGMRWVQCIGRVGRMSWAAGGIHWMTGGVYIERWVTDARKLDRIPRRNKQQEQEQYANKREKQEEQARKVSPFSFVFFCCRVFLYLTYFFAEVRVLVCERCEHNGCFEGCGMSGSP